MRTLAPAVVLAALLGWPLAARAQESPPLSPLTVVDMKLGADSDGRKSLCAALQQAASLQAAYSVDGCTETQVRLSAKPEAERSEKQIACDFIRQPLGSAIYGAKTIIVRRMTPPMTAQKLQVRLETLGVTAVEGLLRAFGFETVAVRDGEPLELHYHGCA